MQDDLPTATGLGFAGRDAGGQFVQADADTEMPISAQKTRAICLNICPPSWRLAPGYLQIQLFRTIFRLPSRTYSPFGNEFVLHFFITY